MWLAARGLCCIQSLLSKVRRAQNSLEARSRSRRARRKPPVGTRVSGGRTGAQEQGIGEQSERWRCTAAEGDSMKLRGRKEMGGGESAAD